MLSLAFITCLQESVLYSDNTRRWAQRHCSWTCAGLHKHLMISGSFLQAFSVFAGIFSSVILDHSSDCGLLDKEREASARGSFGFNVRANSLFGQLRGDWGGGGRKNSLAVRFAHRSRPKYISRVSPQLQSLLAGYFRFRKLRLTSKSLLNRAPDEKLWYPQRKSLDLN